MLTAKAKDHLKKVFKLDVDKLIAAVTDPAEVELADLPDGTLLTADELTARDTNKINEGKIAGKTEGETSAVALAKTEIKKRLNLDIKGERWGDITNEIKAVMDQTSDQKVQLLQQQVQALTTDKEQLTGKVTAAEQSESSRKWNDELIDMFPENTAPGLKAKQRLILMNADIVWETQADGSRVAKRNGELIKDPNTHAPLGPKDVVKTYFTDNNWLDDGKGGGAGPGAGGRGGGNSGPGGGTAGLKKMSAFKDTWLLANPGKNENGTEFDAAVQAHTKDMPDFDWHN